MSETSLARVHLADFGIELPQRGSEPEAPVELRERNVSIELWMLAAAFAAVIAFVAAFAGNKAPEGPRRLVAERSTTPAVMSAPKARQPVVTELAPEVVTAAPARMGGLQINAPEGAVVFVDGRRIGRAPVDVQQVRAGERRIEIRKGDIVVNDALTIPAREVVTYDLALILDED